MNSTLALVGGGEFRPGCDFDRDLLEVAGTDNVLVLPTGAAFEHPERSVHAAEAWFEGLGARARGLMVLKRPDAMNPEYVEAVRASRFTYLTGGSPMHLRSVLKETPLWDALVEAMDRGGVLAASAAGAMVVSDPMVDPRGGAFTLGLGLLPRIAVVPQVEQWSADRLHRTLDLADDDTGLLLLTLASGAAALRNSDGTWTAHGRVGVYRGHAPVDLAELAATTR